MARKIRFPLKMKNGLEVRTLEELQQNFDLDSVLGYFTDGKLITWLTDRYHGEQAEAVSALSSDMPDLNQRLCEILGIEYQADEDETDIEIIQRRNEKKKILNSETDDSTLLNNLDIVALDQDDLLDILDSDSSHIYLYKNSFFIPFGRKNVTYTGFNEAEVKLEKNRTIEDYVQTQIIFENVRFAEGTVKQIEPPKPSLDQSTASANEKADETPSDRKAFKSVFGNVGAALRAALSGLRTGIEESCYESDKVNAEPLVLYESENDTDDPDELYETAWAFIGYDDERAVRFFKKAADLGNKHAQDLFTLPMPYHILSQLFPWYR